MFVDNAKFAGSRSYQPTQTQNVLEAIAYSKQSTAIVIVLAAHRVPPQLLGLVPTGTTGFGSVVPAAQVFAVNELVPLQARLMELND